MLRPCPPTKRPNGVISDDDDIGPSDDSGHHDGDDDMMIHDPVGRLNMCLAHLPPLFLPLVIVQLQL